MLSLMEPLEVEGLQVFRDDEDPRKFYLMPDQPVIPVDDEGEAEFLFIKYLKEIESTAEDEEVGGGLVLFRSTLAIDPARRERVVAELRTRLDQDKAAGKKPFGLEIGSTEPLLASPLWTAGECSLATFRASETGLVRHATETVPADLAGDLGASFVLELDDDGSEVFWSAFQDRDQQIPIIIMYRLTYKARVSATMEIHARREALQQRLWNQALPCYLLRQPIARWLPLAPSGALATAALATFAARTPHAVKAMIPRHEVKAAIQRSILEHEIDVRIETDSAAASGVQDALFKLASEVLADRIIPALFGDATGEPGARDESDTSAQMDLLEVQERALAGPAVSFDLNLTHHSTIERTIQPNGPIHLLLPDAEAVASSFKELRLSDGFFSLMKVTASTAGVNFERDGIASVHVFFEYEEQDEAAAGRPWVRRRMDDVLRREEDVIYWRFDTARRADGGHKRAYRYRTEVIYRDGPRSETPWSTGSNRKLLITPRAMGALRVELVLTASSEVVESARVALRHRGASDTLFEKTLELTPQGDRRTWFQYTGELTADDPDLNPPEYEYQVTYRTGASEIVLPWRRTREETLEIPSPFKKRLTFNIRPQGSFEGVSRVSGDIVYDDDAHQYRVRESFQLPSPEADATFVVSILEGGPEVAHWRARIHYQDGTAQDLGSGEATPGTVWVGGATDFLEVQVLPDLLDFEADVQLAVVTLTYGDSPTTFTFSKQSRQAVTWRVGRSDPSLDSYDAHIRFIAYDRTKSSEVSRRQIRDQVLVLDRVQA